MRTYRRVHPSKSHHYTKKGEKSETLNLKNLCNTPKVATKVDHVSEYVRKRDAKDSNRVHKIKRHQFNINYRKKQMSEILLTFTQSKVLVCFGKFASCISLCILNFEYMSINDIKLPLRRSAANNWQISTSCLYLVE